MLLTSAVCFLLMSASVHHQIIEPPAIEVFRASYPDIEFEVSFDGSAGDWRVAFGSKESSEQTVLYWANGRLLPESELGRTENYWPLISVYDSKVRDPADFTEKDIEDIREASSRETRRYGAITPLFFLTPCMIANRKRALKNT